MSNFFITVDFNFFSRSLQSELTFYGQSVLRLGVLPAEELSRERFERLWGVGIREEQPARRA